MIPEFELGDVLPPFLNGDVVGDFYPRSPYRASILELISRFGTSPERARILHGLLTFREDLRASGIIRGFQWIDGSFVENVEEARGRAPRDVDVISLIRRPVQDEAAWGLFVGNHSETLLDQGYCKATYMCDSYFIDLDIEPAMVADQTAYWFGLFSHQRDTFRWKGIVQVDLEDDDAAARQRLTAIEAQW